MCEGAGVEVANDLNHRPPTIGKPLHPHFEGVIFCPEDLSYKQGAGQYAIRSVFGEFFKFRKIF
jgi:hypothetical protein